MPPNSAAAPPSIVGKWEIVRAELDAEPVPELVIQKTQLELSDRLYAVHFDGQVADRGHYILSAGEPHTTITLHCTEGPNLGRIIPAIYQVAGDRLRICYGFGA